MSFLKRFQISLESLYPFSDKKKYVVAYSGGVDSLVLLHCLKQIDGAVRAVHVHHGLQAVADDWVKHCQQTCLQLEIPLDVLYVDADKKRGQSPEETARKVRYQALQDNLKRGECLVTAQHLNDQAETLLLQLFRTAGPAGLSAMPAVKQFGGHVHIRPLLPFFRNDIEAYARENDLQWVEDPSNEDVSFDRNFLRKEILPQLENRWPEVNARLSTVSRLQSNNLQVLEDMAAIDMANALSVQDSQSNACIVEVMSILSIPTLKQLSSSRLLNLLRYWIIVTLNKQPTRNLLEEIERSLLNSQPDAKPDIIFSDYSFRKFQENLYLLKTGSDFTVQNELVWDVSSPLEISGLNIKLEALESPDKGLNKKLLTEQLTVGFRKGGEKFHPSGRRHSQSLKKLLQEAGIPPWERDVVPLVYLGDELIAVGEIWVCRGFAVDEGESGWFVSVKSL